MFPRLVFLLCAASLLITCFSQHTKDLDDCFPPHPNKTDKDWIFEPSKDYSGRSTDKSSLPRQNFDRIIEYGINRQINYEFYAHYTYLSMAYHFERDDIYLPGFSKFFKKMAEEEHEHAQKFMNYQNKRGGRIRLHHIKSPCSQGIWGNGTVAMEQALKLEQRINQELLKLHNSHHDDPQFHDFLETNFLEEQVESIKQLSNYVNTLRRFDDALGEYQFDKLTLQGLKDDKKM